MLAIGRFHLDWGSADQPPLTPVLAAAMDALAADSVLLLRLPAVLATAGAVVMAALIARELGGDRRAQSVTAVAQATGVWVTLSGHWLTPYALEPVQWLLLIWLMVRWVRTRHDRLLLAAGVVAGIAALTKFQVLLLCAVLLVTVLLFGPRELLRRPLLWAGGAVGALVAAPTLWWQHRHGWPQLQMTQIVAGEADVLYGGRPGIAVQLLVFAGLAGAVLVAYGLWRMVRDETLRPYRFVAATSVVLFVVFVATAGRPYYLCGLYAPLAAAGALGFQRRRESRPAARRWAVWPAAALSVAVAAGALALSVTFTRSDVGERIARDTGAAYGTLSADERARTAVIAESYVVAAYLDAHAHRHGLPRAFSFSRSYGYFPPPEPDHDSALYVGADDSRVRPFFADSRIVAPIGDDMHVYLMTDRHRPWPEIWARLQTLTV
ncbi:glycosyl transferase family 39 [Mycobacterium sp. PS03-16]|nr:glycosyl transferase family 39 [Mycobacterium sp. PS03-16]